MAATEESWSNGASQQEWKGWWNWRVAFNCKLHRSLSPCGLNRGRRVIDWRLIRTAVIGIGFAMGLFGYDNAFTSPLVSLPLFVAKYQGPGFEGAYAFTVRSPFHDRSAIPIISNRHVYLPLELGKKLGFVDLCASHRRRNGRVRWRSSSEVARASEDHAGRLCPFCCAWLISTTFCAEYGCHDRGSSME